ncbi:hypothetical protein AB2G28_24495 (plasmid) [Escherichia coli]
MKRGNGVSAVWTKKTKSGQSEAAKALALFARLNEQDCDGHPVSEIIVDFIANLMHLGEAINFRVLDEESAVIPLVRIAAVHFNAETKS